MPIFSKRRSITSAFFECGKSPGSNEKRPCVVEAYDATVTTVTFSRILRKGIRDYPPTELVTRTGEVN